MISTLSMDKDNWQKLEETLGYSFRDKTLLVSAMTHKSFANEYPDTACPDNERLEFLGDAVLDLIVSEHLMDVLPRADEGDLSRTRADVVSMPSLAALARSLGIGRGLLLGKGESGSGGRDKPSLLADALEALFGAVFVDSGYEEARSVVLPLIAPLLKQAAADEGQDYKSRLQEFLQAARKELPVYMMTDASGPDHDRVYRVEVLIEGSVLGTGQGKTKKSAEQSAAAAALKVLDKDS